MRPRLAGALLDAVAEHGYLATKIADVITRAGVSRKTFYAHFANREECALYACELVAEEALRLVQRAHAQAQGGRPDRARAAVAALFGAAAANPGAVRLSIVEIGALGPAGIELRDRTVERFGTFVAAALDSGAGPPAPLVVTGLVGGIYRVLYGWVRASRAPTSEQVAGEIVRWAECYVGAPRTRASAPRPGPLRMPGAIAGGRAPGTLAPHPLLGRRRGLPRTDPGISRSLVVHSQRERILDAVANLTAANGYEQLKVDEVALEAAVSLQAFYEHFEDKHDAFLVAYEVGHGKALAAVERAFAAEEDWRLGVRAGIATLLEFLASEPAFARIALIDVLSASARSAARSDAGIAALAQMLLPGIEQAPAHRRPPAVAVEAVAGGIFELCLAYALARKLDELPSLAVPAAYFALAPFIGAEAASSIALDAPRRPGRR